MGRTLLGRTLSADEQQRVRAALAGTGWEPVLDYAPRHRFDKAGFRLVCAARDEREE